MSNDHIMLIFLSKQISLCNRCGYSWQTKDISDFGLQSARYIMLLAHSTIFTVGWYVSAANYFIFHHQCSWSPPRDLPWPRWVTNFTIHYSDVIMSASQLNGASVVCSTDCSGANLRKHQSSALLALVRGIPWWPVNSPKKRASNAETDDVIMIFLCVWFFKINYW